MNPLLFLLFWPLAGAAPPTAPLGPALHAALTNQESAARVERESWVMGTRLRVTIDAADLAVAARAAEEALRAIEQADAILSTWDDRAEMARLNAAPVGTSNRPSPELRAWLEEADGWRTRTGRAFDPAVGAIVDAWGLRGRGRVPSGVEVRDALEASGGGSLRIEAGSFERLAASAWVDTGGFGKGAALRAAADRLAVLALEHVVLDLGGQLLVLGSTIIDVAHPLHRDRPVARLQIRDASVATSGQSERFIEVGGERFGHVVDPRTGMPVRAWGSVTVVASDALTADALATALYVMGPKDGLAWALARQGASGEHEPVAALFLEMVDGEPRARWTPALEPSLVAEPAR